MAAEIGFGPRQSHRTRRDRDARRAAARTNHPPATAGLSRVFGGNLQPLATPDPFDPHVIDDPSCISPQLRDLAIALAPILASEFDDVGGQTLFIFSPPRNAPLRRTMLPEHPANPAFGHARLNANVVDAGWTLSPFLPHAVNRELEGERKPARLANGSMSFGSGADSTVRRWRSPTRTRGLSGP